MTDTLERVETYQQLIGGEFVDAADGRTAGKDGSKYALEDYTFVKHVMINTGS